MNGFAAGFESTGDEGRLSAVANFFDIVTNAHTYATGGNNDGEYWQAPRELASSIAAVSCWSLVTPSLAAIGDF